MRVIVPPSPLPVRRLPELPLPPYRFQAGVFPHPTRSEHGHGQVVPEDPEALFLYACDLFDHRYYWEAHDAWEVLWHQAALGSVTHRFLQGLILCATALYKLHEGREEVASELFLRAVGYLEDVVISRGPEVQGVDLLRLVAEVDHALHEGPMPVLKAAEG